MNAITFYVSIIFHFASVLCIEKYDVSELMTEIVKLNTKLENLEEKHNAEIGLLKEDAERRENEYALKFETLEKFVDELVETNKELLLRENGRLQGYHEKDDRHELHEQGNDDHNTEPFEYEKEDQMKAVENTMNTQYIHKRVAPNGNHNIAFSAYLDHDEDHLSDQQTLVFNQVLLNDGNAYNKYAGTFTAPVSGVYSFSFFIGQRDIHDSWVALWVNNDNKIDAATDSYHTYQDSQGGNTVNLKLAKNDIVHVKHLGNSDQHIEGSSSLRLTSFSGFLLYPTADGTFGVVGVGK